MTATSYINKGLALARKGELHQAAILLCEAVKLDPDHAEAYQHLGEILIPLKRWEDAQACFRQAIALRPHFPEAHNHLGIVLNNTNRLREAEACYRQAIEQNPGYAEAFHNLGSYLKQANRLAEAETCYRRALTLQPDLRESRFSLATLFLLQGQYDLGWPLHESRWEGKFRLDIPLWQGEDLSGRNILLFFEQGFGDMIQFVRYAHLVAKLAASTTVWIQKPLQRLLIGTQSSFSICKSRHLSPESFDFACSLLSLPFLFNTSLDTIPADIPYIHAAGETVAKWRDKIAGAAKGKTRVGVVWAGNPEHSDDRNRSIPFALFRGLFDFEAAAFFSLQANRKNRGLQEPPRRVFDYSGDFVDFAETAGVIANLDLVIAVDTAVAHLAGAMGKETWLLLPFKPDWRWGLERENTPWYPTMRLFRQRTAGDWQEVLERVMVALSHRAKI